MCVPHGCGADTTKPPENQPAKLINLPGSNARCFPGVGEPRTHRQTLVDSRRLEEMKDTVTITHFTKVRAKYGVRPSPLQHVIDNIIHGVPVEPVHCLFLGATRAEFRLAAERWTPAERAEFAVSLLEQDKTTPHADRIGAMFLLRPSKKTGSSWSSEMKAVDFKSLLFNYIPACWPNQDKHFENLMRLRCIAKLVYTVPLRAADINSMEPVVERHQKGFIDLYGEEKVGACVRQ
eukprot:m.316683 g.316683  ORF g.316683 m.316683 type:complete len:235 (+) comp19679_c0_seq25:913-1617(+)